MVGKYGGYGSVVGIDLSRSIAVMALVLIDTADILVAQILRMLIMGGRRLGVPSIALLFAAFGLGYKEKSNMITSLLVSGGAINLGSLLVPPAIGLLHYRTKGVDFLRLVGRQ
jgi:hypothetical protein